MYNRTNRINDELTFDDKSNYENKKRNKMNLSVNETEN